MFSSHIKRRSAFTPSGWWSVSIFLFSFMSSVRNLMVSISSVVHVCQVSGGIRSSAILDTEQPTQCQQTCFPNWHRPICMACLMNQVNILWKPQYPSSTWILSATKRIPDSTTGKCHWVTLFCNTVYHPSGCNTTTHSAVSWFLLIGFYLFL